MIRQFHCNSCQKEFTADDALMVVCPECQSDNVQPAKPKNPIVKYVLIGLVAIALAVGCAFLVKSLKDMKDSDATENTDTTEEVTVEKVEEDITKDVGGDIVVTIEPIEVSKLVADEKSKTYSFTAKPHGETNGTLKYFLTDHKTGVKKEYVAPGGQFTNVPPAGDGTYILRIESHTADGKIDAGEIEIVGFNAFQQKIDKPTVSQVQGYINRMIHDEVGGLQAIKSSGLFASVVNITVDGAPCSLDDLGMEIMGHSSVSVTSVGYDDKNRVNRITLSLN